MNRQLKGEEQFSQHKTFQIKTSDEETCTPTHPEPPDDLRIYFKINLLEERSVFFYRESLNYFVFQWCLTIL